MLPNLEAETSPLIWRPVCKGSVFAAFILGGDIFSSRDYSLLWKSNLPSHLHSVSCFSFLPPSFPSSLPPFIRPSLPSFLLSLLFLLPFLLFPFPPSVLYVYVRAKLKAGPKVVCKCLLAIQKSTLFTNNQLTLCTSICSRGTVEAHSLAKEIEKQVRKK